MEAMRKWLPLFVMLAVGCSSGSSSESAGGVASDAAMVAKEAPASAPTEQFRGRTVSSPGVPSPPVPSPRQIIRQGSISLRVDELAASEKRLRSIATAQGGWIDGLDGSTDESVMTLRIPSESFDDTVEKVLAVGSMISQKVTLTDVTDQIVDIGARLKALRAEETAYVRMLAQTRQLSDTLMVRERLGAVRQQIEQADAMRTNLSRQAAMSTLEVTLLPIPVGKPQGDDSGWFAASMADAVGSFGAIARTLVGLLVYIVVFSPIWFPISWLVWRNRRRVLPKQAA
ncbi:DUF4349 domain-containing protein [bacterium]|nr:MAG: DUF4349 domain-containing protein [bacterium]